MLLIRDDRFLLHETGQHPESPARLTAIHQMLDAASDRWTRDGVLQSREITEVDWPALGARCEQEYLEHLKEIDRSGGGRLDVDTVAGKQSVTVARLAVGAAREAIDAVFEGQSRTAFVACRPPGHHALDDRAMGFCLFNNVAFAADHARESGLERVLIVDWDVHHGNGTQAAFYHDEAVHFVSAHRWPFYPGTGAADERGSGPGRGTVWNVPLPFGVSRQEYRAAFTKAVEQAAEACRPEIVLISAGFDAHAADPIGSLGLESEDFADLTDIVCGVAHSHANGRVVSLLEGGYNPPKLAESVRAHLERLVAHEANSAET